MEWTQASRQMQTRKALSDKVDGHTLAAEATGAADTMDVELTIVGQIIVNHKRNLARATLMTVAHGAHESKI